MIHSYVIADLIVIPSWLSMAAQRESDLTFSMYVWPILCTRSGGSATSLKLRQIKK